MKFEEVQSSRHCKLNWLICGARPLKSFCLLFLSESNFTKKFKAVEATAGSFEDLETSRSSKLLNDPLKAMPTVDSLSDHSNHNQQLLKFDFEIPLEDDEAGGIGVWFLRRYFVR